MASQMSSAVLDHTTVDITLKRYSFRATGAVMRFPGFTALYEESLAESPETGCGRRGPQPPPATLVVGQDVQTHLAGAQSALYTTAAPRF